MKRMSHGLKPEHAVYLVVMVVVVVPSTGKGGGITEENATSAAHVLQAGFGSLSCYE
jgi:hypothetical protein